MTPASLAATLGQLVIAIGGGGAVVAALRLRAERRRLDAEARRDDADAVQLVSGAAIGLITPLQTRITEQARELDDARHEITTLRARVTELTTALNTREAP